MLSSAKPSSGNIHGPTIGPAGTAVRIIADKCQTRFRTQLGDATADGDEHTVSEANGHVYGSIRFNGTVVGGNLAIGIATLRTGNTLAVDLLLASGHRLVGNVKIGDIEVSWVKDGSDIPLSVSGQFTGEISEVVANP